MSDLENRLRSAMQEETLDISARSTLGEDMVVRGSKVRRRRRVVGGIAGLAVLAAVVPIWHTIDSANAPVHPVGPSPSVITQAPPSHSDALPAYGTGAISMSHHPNPTPYVVNLRAAQHGTYDRVVIDLNGAISSYRVEYVPKLIQGASGAPVPLPGKAFISIVLTTAAAHDDTGHSVFEGDLSQVSGMEVVLGAALTEDNEGTVSFGLGLSKHSAFRVFSLKSPTRLVIDIRH